MHHQLPYHLAQSVCRNLSPAAYGILNILSSLETCTLMWFHHTTDSSNIARNAAHVYTTKARSPLG